MLRDLTAFHIFRAPDEPATGGDPVTEPVEGVVTETEEPEFLLPEDFTDQVKSWGVSVDELAQAAALHKALQTEDGVVEQFIATGQSLGFGIKELQRLFADEVAPVAPVAPAAPTPDPILGDDPDRLLTASEVKAIVDRQRDEFEGRFTQSETQRAEAEQAQRQKIAFGTIESFFDGKEVKDGETRAFIAQLAERTIPATADSFDPAVLNAALERGMAEYEAFVEKQAQAFIAKKAGTAAAQPTHVGGGTAGGEAEAETDYAKLGQGALNAAKEKVRARLRDSGEL